MLGAYIFIIVVLKSLTVSSSISVISWSVIIDSFFFMGDILVWVTFLYLFWHVQKFLLNAGLENIILLKSGFHCLSLQSVAFCSDKHLIPLCINLNLSKYVWKLC